MHDHHVDLLRRQCFARCLLVCLLLRNSTAALSVAAHAHPRCDSSLRSNHKHFSLHISLQTSHFIADTPEFLPEGPWICWTFPHRHKSIPMYGCPAISATSTTNIGGMCSGYEIACDCYSDSRLERVRSALVQYHVQPRVCNVVEYSVSRTAGPIQFKEKVDSAINVNPDSLSSRHNTAGVSSAI